MSETIRLIAEFFAACVGNIICTADWPGRVAGSATS